MTEKLKEYFDLLSKWNKSIKLVSSADDFDGFVFEHVEDALRMSRHLEGAKSLIDLGTGAGLPGILIKLDRPKMRVVLLDSIRKKTNFCEEAIRSLRLEGIETITGRAEDEAIIEALGPFDAIVSRATWKLAEFVEMALPYMKRSGSRVIAMKGARWRDELSEAKGIIEANMLKEIAYDEYELADGRKRCLVVLGS